MQEVKSKSIVIVGYGKVGKVLHKAFIEKGFVVKAVVSKHFSEPFVWCNTLLCKEYRELINVKHHVIVLSLRDSAVIEWVEINKNLIPKEAIVVHTIGACSAELLQPIREVGSYVVAWHPLQTFTGSETVELLQNVTFGIDGDEIATEWGFKTAIELGANPLHVAPNKRETYHLSAVFACNLAMVLMETAFEIMRQAGFSKTQSKEVLYPLVSQTISNVFKRNIISTITGPVSRGDSETVQKHLSNLQEMPQTSNIYKALSMLILEASQERITSEQYIELKRLLQI